MYPISTVVDVVTPRARPDPSERELREMFGSCGRILAMYPWTGNSTEKLHHFIVFQDERSALDSLSRFRGFFQVSSPRTDPIMKERFYRVSEPVGRKRRRSVTPSRSDYMPASRKRIPTGPRARGSSPVRSQAPQPSRLPPLRWTNSVAEDGGHFAPASRKDSPQSSVSDRPSTDSSTAHITSSCDEDGGSNSSSQPTSPDTEQKVSPTVTVADPNPVISLSSGEKNATSELEDPPEMAAEAVEQLRKSEDRAAWMLMAVKYRRLGKLHEAEQVMAGFIDWMTERGDEFDLKPAFLFLSMLHADEAKAAASGLTASEALQNSKILNSQKTAARYASIAHNLDGSAFQSLKQFVIHHDPNAEKENIDPKSVPNASAAHSPPRPDRAPGQTTSLDRTELAYLRRAKRRVEDDYVEERSVRRKLESSLRDTQEQLWKANKLLDFKQGQIKTEVESRRKTEQELQQVASMTAAKEEQIRQDTFRKVCLDLASHLTQSAGTQSLASLKIE